MTEQQPGTNPFRAPGTEQDGAEAAAVAAAEHPLRAIRREHLQHEVNIKGLATLTIMTGLLGLLGLLLFAGLPRGLHERMLIGTAALLAFGLMLAGFLLRLLQRSGRRLYTLVLAASLGFAGFGVFGTERSPWLFVLPLLMVYSVPVVYLVVLFSPKGSRVLTASYRSEVIPATRDMRWRWSPWVLVALSSVLLVSATLVLALTQRL